MRAEDRTDCGQFAGVSNLGGRRMSVEIADLLWSQARLAKGLPHRPLRSRPVRRSGCDVIGVGRRAVSDEFRDRLDAASPCVSERLQNEHAGAFPHDEPIPRAIERT